MLKISETKSTKCSICGVVGDIGSTAEYSNWHMKFTLCHTCLFNRVSEIGELVGAALSDALGYFKNLDLETHSGEVSRKFSLGYWRTIAIAEHHRAHALGDHCDEFKKIQESHDLKAAETAEAMASTGYEFDPAAERAKVSNGLRFNVMKRDGFHCQLCGATGKTAQLVIDHIVPVSKGGKTEMENLQTLCFRCNSGKRDKVE